MKADGGVVRRTALIFVAAAVLLPSASHAQGNIDAWEWRASIYGWFPGIEGETRFPSGAGGPSINVDADTLLENLKMAFMGTLEARKGQWGGLADWFYPTSVPASLVLETSRSTDKRFPWARPPI
jgi:hypothetical protein